MPHGSRELFRLKAESAVRLSQMGYDWHFVAKQCGYANPNSAHRAALRTKGQALGVRQTYRDSTLQVCGALAVIFAFEAGWSEAARVVGAERNNLRRRIGILIRHVWAGEGGRLTPGSIRV